MTNFDDLLDSYIMHGHNDLIVIHQAKKNIQASYRFLVRKFGSAELARKQINIILDEIEVAEVMEEEIDTVPEM